MMQSSRAQLLLQRTAAAARAAAAAPASVSPSTGSLGLRRRGRLRRTRAAARAAARPRSCRPSAMPRSRTSFIDRSAEKLRLVPAACSVVAKWLPMNSITPTWTVERGCRHAPCTLRTTTSSGRRQTVTGAPWPSGTGSAKSSSAPLHVGAAGGEQLAVEEVHLADEIGDEGGGRPAVDLVGRADLLDPALAHHHDPVGHGERLLLVVRDHDRGHAEPVLQVADLAAQPGAHPRVERRKRLVEQQQARRQGQRAGQRDALLLAAGELGRILVGLLGQADQRQQLAHALVDLGARLAGRDQAVADIVLDGQVGEQRVGLEHDAEVALGHRQGRDVAPALLDACPRSARRGRRSRAAAWSCRSPTGPRNETNSPGRMSRSTSSSAVNGPKRLVTPRIRR